MEDLIEKNKKLCEKYPFLTWRGDPLMSFQEIAEPNYEYTWEDEMERGWVTALCPAIWDDLKAILKKAEYIDKFRFECIKEKYGTLRIYYDGVPASIADEVDEWCSKYEALSEKFCVHCGKPATRMTKGWILFVCSKCAKKINGGSVPLTEDK